MPRERHIEIKYPNHYEQGIIHKDPRVTAMREARMNVLRGEGTSQDVYSIIRNGLSFWGDMQSFLGPDASRLTDYYRELRDTGDFGAMKYCADEISFLLEGVSEDYVKHPDTREDLREDFTKRIVMWQDVQNQIRAEQLERIQERSAVDPTLS
jgi:hypothetical protein